MARAAKVPARPVVPKGGPTGAIPATPKPGDHTLLTAAGLTGWIDQHVPYKTLKASGHKDSLVAACWFLANIEAQDWFDQGWTVRDVAHVFQTGGRLGGPFFTLGHVGRYLHGSCARIDYGTDEAWEEGKNEVCRDLHEQLVRFWLDPIRDDRSTGDA